mmetsp:Transcript_15739/g.39257  ORF Transcript_15739/g.39257 Transcript_15739/m.39257 type:complete len:243 (-) Transcript_15739:104-832(-)
MAASCSRSRSSSLSLNACSVLLASLVSALSWRAFSTRARSLAFMSSTSCTARARSSSPSRLDSARSARMRPFSSSSCCVCTAFWSRARRLVSSNFFSSATSAASSACRCCSTKAASCAFLSTSICFLYSTNASFSLMASLCSILPWSALTLSVSSNRILLARSIWMRLFSALISASNLSASMRSDSSAAMRSIRARSFLARCAWRVFGHFAARSSLSCFRRSRSSCCVSYPGSRARALIVSN